MFKGRPPDGSTLEGARRHAKLISAYWSKRGFDILPRVEDTGARAEHGRDSSVVWGVRSDLVNGMPQRKR
jgi:hypothetical protein